MILKVEKVHDMLGECGHFPVSLVIKSRMLSFWFMLIVANSSNQLANIVYTILLNFHETNIRQSNYISAVRQPDLAIYCGIWINQQNINMSCE